MYKEKQEKIKENLCLRFQETKEKHCDIDLLGKIIEFAFEKQIWLFNFPATRIRAPIFNECRIYFANFAFE